MLRAANRNVRYCYERAFESNDRALKARTQTEREFYQNDEKRWLALGGSFEYQERLTDFMNELGNLLRAPFCRACGAKMRPKLMRCDQDGLAEVDYECARCGAEQTVIELDGKSPLISKTISDDTTAPVKLDFRAER